MSNELSGNGRPESNLVFYRLDQVEKQFGELNNDKQEAWRAIGRLSSDVEGLAQSAKTFQESVIRQFEQVANQLSQEKTDRKEDIEKERGVVDNLRKAARELVFLIAGGAVTFICALILKILSNA